MYLNIGENTIIKTDSIIGIFNIKKIKYDQFIKEFIENKYKKIDLNEFKSIILLTDKNKKIDIYISKFSTLTLDKRLKNVNI